VWHRGALTLPGGLGRLALTGHAGGMVEPDAVWPEGVRVRFAVRGASCRPGRGMPLRRLKQLYQEAGVPPWLRPYVPFLYAGGGLFAVGDLWRCSRTISSRAPVAGVRWEGGLRAHPGFPGQSPAGVHADQEGLRDSARRQAPPSPSA
jgi:tRNA(Ile)-lysidine synthase